MSFLTNEDMLYIDFGDNTFEVESANRKAETVYDGVKYLEQTVTDEEIEEARSSQPRSYILDLIHAAYAAKMPVDQYCEEVISPLLQQQTESYL